MALMKYKDVIKLAKEKIDEAMAPLRAREMRKRCELEVCKLESTMAEKEQKIQELSAKYPIDFYALADALDDLALTERRKTQLEEIAKELFDESEPTA